MVKGIEVFRKHFAGYEDKYVLIGGTACDLLFQKNGLSFRATRDLDIILVAEALTPDFGIKFWEFIKNGQYVIQQRSDGSPIFYRFRNPQDKAFPAMLELFSRSSKELEPESAGPNLRKIPLGDEISSLSAILLNNAYYALLKDGTIHIDGVSLLSDAYLLLFKAKAWLDLSGRKKLGGNVDSRDIKKHKNDVFRLSALLSPTLKVDIHGEVKNDLVEFINACKDDTIDPKALGLSGSSQSDILERIKIFYGI
jgi:hypothetical protein